MESTTPAAAAKQTAKKHAAAKKRAAAKRKPKIAAKPRARGLSAAQVAATLKEPVLLEVQEPTPLALAAMGLELADIVTGSSSRRERVGRAIEKGMSNWDGESNDGAVESEQAAALTLEEISLLLQRREEMGRVRGHGEGYRDARRNIQERLQRERSSAVAGALLMVVGQLEGVLHVLAEREAPYELRAQEGGRQLAVLSAEFAKAAERFANGETLPGQS